jgi:hypothetical protein
MPPDQSRPTLPSPLMEYNWRMNTVRSPFPGMDPYLERHWLDVHTGLIGEARKHLNRVLPEGLIARAEERVAVEANEEYVRHRGPDVRVFAPGSAEPDAGLEVAVIDAPFELVDSDPVTERFIRIIDEGGHLITVIEFLSPGNKRAPGLEEYRSKRGELLSAGTHVVEVDLIRAGDWLALMSPERCDPAAESPYRAIVRTGQRARGYLFPMTFRQPLPDVPVPLRPTDTPAALPLQKMVDTVYEDGRYGQTIDYGKPPTPPLDRADREWAEQWLRSAGR